MELFPILYFLELASEMLNKKDYDYKQQSLESAKFGKAVHHQGQAYVAKAFIVVLRDSLCLENKTIYIEEGCRLLPKIGWKKKNL